MPLPPQNSQPVLGSTQPSTQQALGVPFPGIKGPGHEFDYTLPPRAEVKNELTYISRFPIRISS